MTYWLEHDVGVAMYVKLSSKASCPCNLIIQHKGMHLMHTVHEKCAIIIGIINKLQGVRGSLLVRGYSHTIYHWAYKYKIPQSWFTSYIFTHTRAHTHTHTHTNTHTHTQTRTHIHTHTHTHIHTYTHTHTHTHTYTYTYKYIMQAHTWSSLLMYTCNTEMLFPLCLW